MDTDKIKQYYADDYAGLETKSIDFYFGYEEEKNGEWAFTVKKKRKLILKLSETEIKEKTQNWKLDAPINFLLAGIGIYFNEYIPYQFENLNY